MSEGVVNKKKGGNSKVVVIVALVIVLVIAGSICFFFANRKPKSLSGNVIVSTNSSVNIPADKVSADAKHMRYINDNMELNGGDVDWCEDYDGKVLGVENLHVKNKGDKDISNLQVTVYFLDAKDDIVKSVDVITIDPFEDSIKSGESWQMDDDMYYQLENIPKAVDVSRYAIAITDIRYSDETK